MKESESFRLLGQVLQEEGRECSTGSIDAKQFLQEWPDDFHSVFHLRAWNTTARSDLTWSYVYDDDNGVFFLSLCGSSNRCNRMIVDINQDVRTLRQQWVNLETNKIFSPDESGLSNNSFDMCDIHARLAECYLVAWAKNSRAPLDENTAKAINKVFGLLDSRRNPAKQRLRSIETV